jgi:hypothetical protein
MSTLQIEKINAVKAYNETDDKGKVLLSNLFGKHTFGKITDRVQTIEDILTLSGKTMADIERPGDTDDEVAGKLSKLIALVYNNDAIANGGKPLDPGNTKQPKYYPWHEVVKDPSHPSGFGLSCDVCDYWRSGSLVGVRHCFIDSSHAIDAGKKFINVYERLKIR